MHTVIRKDIVAAVPVQRLLGTLILTHYVPAKPMSGTPDDWRALAATNFTALISTAGVVAFGT